MQTKKSFEVLCDFDGTITNEDIGFSIIQTFAGPGWLEIEEAYQRGEKGSREAMTEIFQLTSVSEKDLQQFVDDNFFIDPYFPAFLDFCRQKEIKVTVVSDGFDFYIERIFAKYKLDLPYFANKLQVVEKRLKADFPYRRSECGQCGTCKLQFAEKIKQKGNSLVYIGDGHSDRCVSQAADILFAKDFLATYCRENGIEFHAFTTFAEILTVLKTITGEEG